MCVNFAQVTIGSEDLKANHMIQQIFQFPQEMDKYRSLVKLLEQEMDGSRLLVRPSLLVPVGGKLFVLCRGLAWKRFCIYEEPILEEAPSL